MNRYSEGVQRVLHTFFSSTGIGAMCFDIRFNLIAFEPSNTVANDLLALDTTRIIDFLAEKFSQTPNSKSVFYTFFLDENLVCNIVLLDKDGGFIGAFVTQAVLIKNLSITEKDVLAKRTGLDRNEHIDLRSYFARIPVISPSTLTATGETLESLSRYAYVDNPASQTLYSKTGVIDKDEIEKPIDTQNLNAEGFREAMKLEFINYLNLKECIQSGNSKTINEVIGNIWNEAMESNQIDANDYMRSLKNYCIKISAMAAYAAVDAHSPYEKTMELADELIRQAEKTKTVSELFELMQKVLIDFARSVEINRLQTYSKPVRHVLDYIQAHYDEKITLEMLAEQTNLSTFYLSTLIKKETGLMLMDNINAVRVEEGKKLLLDGNNRVIEVAQQVGFNYQNHFSTVFKKFTGFSPTDYMKTMGISVDSQAIENFEERTVPIFADRLRKLLIMLPELSAVARIVEPQSHASWLVNAVSEEISHETCYEYWQSGSSCVNCISEMAYLQNCVFTKIGRNKNNQNVLLIAIPKTLGNKTYVMEIMIDVTDKFFMDVNINPDNGKPADPEQQALQPGKELIRFLGRNQLNKDLPVFLRRSKLENSPFSIILLSVECFSAKIDFSEPDVWDKSKQHYAKIISSSINGKIILAGHYAGDIFLIALLDTDYADACMIAKKTAANFENSELEIGGENIGLKISYCVKTLTGEIPDTSELIKSALGDLNNNGINREAME